MNIDRIALKYNIKASLVRDEYDKYWRQVKKELNSPQQLKVGIPFFGSFVVVPKKLKKEIKAVDRKLLFFEGKEMTEKLENLRNEYLNQMKTVCHLLEITSTEDLEVCQICNRWLKDTTTTSS